MGVVLRWGEGRKGGRPSAFVWMNAHGLGIGRYMVRYLSSGVYEAAKDDFNIGKDFGPYGGIEKLSLEMLSAKKPTICLPRFPEASRTGIQHREPFDAPALCRRGLQETLTTRPHMTVFPTEESSG